MHTEIKEAIKISLSLAGGLFIGFYFFSLYFGSTQPFLRALIPALAGGVAALLCRFMKVKEKKRKEEKKVQ